VPGVRVGRGEPGPPVKWKDLDVGVKKVDGKKLLVAHEKIKKILGESIEPFESVRLVQEYRDYWKPDKVKIILLAESHVFTSDEERNIQTKRRETLPGYPSQYARFVYCLAYGEKSLKQGDASTKRDDGTPQFWKLLYACNNPGVTGLGDFYPVRKTNTPDEERIQVKIDLLNDLKRKGVWLVDTSIVALYPKDSRTSGLVEKVVKASWDAFTRDVVCACKPEQVICIGKGLEHAIGEDLKKLVSKVTVIYQPNARLRSEEAIKDFKTCGEIVSKQVNG